jgi:hypothetical protein
LEIIVNLEGPSLVEDAGTNGVPHCLT